MAGSSFALSPGCCCTIPSTVPCLWIPLGNSSGEEDDATTAVPRPPDLLVLTFQQQQRYNFELVVSGSSDHVLLEKLRVKPAHRPLRWWSIVGFLLANVLVIVVPYSLRCRKCRLREEKSLAVY